MKEAVLVVDDDPNICELVKMYLADDYEVSVVHDGGSVVNKISEVNPVLIVLDIMLPVMDGFEVCREIRRNWNIPIIILTAKGEETDKIIGLELGADDYITKPFSPREMTARIKAVLRRVNLGKQKNFLQYPGLFLDYESHLVKINGQAVELTPKEFEMMWLMAANPGKVFSRDDLLNKIWGYDFYGDARTVDSQVKRLRKKMENVPEARTYIHTVWGVGYKFEV